MRQLFVLAPLIATPLLAAAQLVPSPASQYASSPIRRLTTPSGQLINITPQSTLQGARPNNAAGGVVSMPPALQFFVNYAAIMRPVIGATDLLIYASTDPGTAGTRHTDDSGGEFRTDCIASHMGRFDPMVSPGRERAGHLHTFFGNSDIVGTLDDQTLAALPTFGRSTCAGGIGNRSAYWVPTLIDLSRGGLPIVPTDVRVYYKNGTQWRATYPNNLKVVAPPAGLRMIAGTPTATTDQPSIHWSCEDGQMDTNAQHHIPTAVELAAHPQWCAGTDVGYAMTMQVDFPQCWDGVNLDSPGHQAHMAYEDFYTGCPSSHPVVLPEIIYKVDYVLSKIGGRANLPNLRLSSDNYSLSLPGGISGHGDWINGWMREIMEAFVQNCLRGATDCHNDVIDRWDANPHRIMYRKQ